jgi:hypothetical protein
LFSHAATHFLLIGERLLSLHCHRMHSK